MGVRKKLVKRLVKGVGENRLGDRKFEKSRVG